MVLYVLLELAPRSLPPLDALPIMVLISPTSYFSFSVLPVLACCGCFLMASVSRLALVCLFILPAPPYT